jgi:hypothetical protein
LLKVDLLEVKGDPIGMKGCCPATVNPDIRKEALARIGR